MCSLILTGCSPIKIKWSLDVRGVTLNLRKITLKIKGGTSGVAEQTQCILLSRTQSLIAITCIFYLRIAPREKPIILLILIVLLHRTSWPAVVKQKRDSSLGKMPCTHHYSKERSESLQIKPLWCHSFRNCVRWLGYWKKLSIYNRKASARVWVVRYVTSLC